MNSLFSCLSFFSTLESNIPRFFFPKGKDLYLFNGKDYMVITPSGPIQRCEFSLRYTLNYSIFFFFLFILLLLFSFIFLLFFIQLLTTLQSFSMLNELHLHYFLVSSIFYLIEPFSLWGCCTSFTIFVFNTYLFCPR